MSSKDENHFRSCMYLSIVAIDTLCYYPVNSGRSSTTRNGLVVLLPPRSHFEIADNFIWLLKRRSSSLVLQISKADMDRLVMQYLVTEGYKVSIAMREIKG